MKQHKAQHANNTAHYLLVPMYPGQFIRPTDLGRSTRPRPTTTTTSSRVPQDSTAANRPPRTPSGGKTANAHSSLPVYLHKNKLRINWFAALCRSRRRGTKVRTVTLCIEFSLRSSIAIPPEWTPSKSRVLSEGGEGKIMRQNAIILYNPPPSRHGQPDGACAGSENLRPISGHA